MQQTASDDGTMKKFTFKGVLDGFRQTVQQQAKVEQEIPETLRAEHFQLRKVSYKKRGNALSLRRLCWRCSLRLNGLKARSLNFVEWAVNSKRGLLGD